MQGGPPFGKVPWAIRDRKTGEILVEATEQAKGMIPVVELGQALGDSIVGIPEKSEWCR